MGVKGRISCHNIHYQVCKLNMFEVFRRVENAQTSPSRQSRHQVQIKQTLTPATYFDSPTYPTLSWVRNFPQLASLCKHRTSLTWLHVASIEPTLNFFRNCEDFWSFFFSFFFCLFVLLDLFSICLIFFKRFIFWFWLSSIELFISGMEQLFTFKFSPIFDEFVLCWQCTPTSMEGISFLHSTRPNPFFFSSVTGMQSFPPNFSSDPVRTSFFLTSWNKNN